MRIYSKPPKPEVLRAFKQAIKALDRYDLTDIMCGLSERHGGTTPLYEAVEAATEIMDEEGT